MSAGPVHMLKRVRLMVPAVQAKPGPALGQALGPLGLNMAEFCKQFNDRTKNYEKDVPIPVVLTAFSNRTFTFITKTPTTYYFVKKVCGIEKGAGKPGTEVVGKIHVKQIYEIAKVKKRDDHLKKKSLWAICRMITGTCKSMGVEIVSG